MAEFVQQSTEEMLPELEQMERVQLFLAKETRIILKKRTAFEYRLRRRKKEKEDFLQYIQYEVGVLSLVKERRKRIGYFHKHLEIDQAIVQRIHRLFKVVCNRFQDDVKLWLSYINFCQQKGEKVSVTRIYTRMLQIHNRNPELWISAAKFEMEVCGSMENARQLLQRGLRFNSQSKHLWGEYFRMELMNTEKLLKRREILGIAKLEGDENVSDAVLTGRVARVVYDNAVESFEGDVEFVLSLLEICQLFPFTEELEEQIFNQLQTQHSKTELAWDALARRFLYKINMLKKQKQLEKTTRESESESLEKECFQTYDKAVSIMCTEKMYDFYLKACLERVQLPKGSTETQNERVGRTLRIFQEAADMQCLSQEMSLKWVEMMLDCGEGVGDVVRRALNSHPQCVELWIHLLTHHIHRYYHCEDYELTEKIDAVFKEAVSALPPKKSLPVWRAMHEYHLHLDSTDSATEFFEYGLTQHDEVCMLVKQWYLEYVHSGDRVFKETRKLYKRLAESRPVSLTFFEKYISMATGELDVNMKVVRSAFEDAIREYGTSSPELWLKYIRLEVEHPKGNAVNAGTLHWRAMKALDGELCESFSTQYALMQSGHL